MLPHTPLRDSLLWPKLAVYHIGEVLPHFWGEMGNVFLVYAEREEARWHTHVQDLLLHQNALFLVLCLPGKCSYFLFLICSPVSCGLSRSAGSASSAFETYNPRPSNALHPRCNIDLHCARNSCICPHP